HSEEDSGVSFVFPPVPQQVTIQTNHQRQESQRVLARSPSPPRMSTDTLTHTLNHRVSLPLISSIFSLFLFQKRWLLSMIAAIRVLPVFRLLLLHCPSPTLANLPSSTDLNVPQRLPILHHANCPDKQPYSNTSPFT